jgi:hypothetical protein
MIYSGSDTLPMSGLSQHQIGKMNFLQVKNNLPVDNCRTLQCIAALLSVSSCYAVREKFRGVHHDSLRQQNERCHKQSDQLSLSDLYRLHDLLAIGKLRFDRSMRPSAVASNPRDRVH